MLFHHKLQTRNHGDTPHKKDLMMLMIERCAMVACYGTHCGSEGSTNQVYSNIWAPLASINLSFGYWKDDREVGVMFKMACLE